MLAGDLSTMALADVLQWIDGTRGRALLEVSTGEGRETWMVAEERMVVAAAPPLARGQLATDGTPASPGPGLVAVALTSLLDLFLSPDGKFVLREGAPTPTPAVPVSMPIQFLVMEGLRLLDEWPRIRDTYPLETARLAATDRDPGPLGAVAAAVHRLALDAPGLGEARLVLGLSKTGFLRAVDELRARGLVEVEGIPHGPDVEGSLIRQAEVLLREKQYAEAVHVFRSLLVTNPLDRRVSRLLQDAERMQIEAAYERFGPTDVVSLAEGASAARLRGTELTLYEHLSRPRSVAVLVLVSPLRELETLAALTRLASRGLVTVESAD